MKLRFRLPNEEHARSCTPCGSSLRPTFNTKRDPKTGGFDLVKTGERDQYSLIQSFAAVTDVNAILDRFSRGDVSALSRVRGVFGDVSQFGSDPHVNHDLVNRANAAYEALPSELMQKYPSFADFLASFASPDAFKAFEANLSAFKARSAGGAADAPANADQGKEATV